VSPTLALQSPVFLFYLTLTAAVVSLAGGILAVLKLGLSRSVDQAWNAYRGWLVIVPMLGLGLFLGREATIILLTLVSGLGFFEFARATTLNQDRFITGVVYLGIAAIGGICLMTDPVTGTPGWYGLFMVWPVFVIAVILIVPVVRNRKQGQLQMIAFAVVGFVYFGWMFGHVAFLANSTHAYSYLGYLLLAVALNDVAAYVFGKLFGRHPLCSNISPKKTWEGAAGALIVSLLLPWILLPTFPHLDQWDCMALGLIVGIGGQLGDLVVSVFKRDLGLKDMGTLIPGHGGVLDRIDSLIYVAPLFFHYVRCGHDLHSAA
jgi:phosphatidate cytidylyltransferase